MRNIAHEGEADNLRMTSSSVHDLQYTVATGGEAREGDGNKGCSDQPASQTRHTWWPLSSANVTLDRQVVPAP